MIVNRIYLYVNFSKLSLPKHCESSGFSVLDHLKNWKETGNSSRLIHNELLQTVLMMIFLLYILCFKYFIAKNILQLHFSASKRRLMALNRDIRPTENITGSVHVKKVLPEIPW